jgi:hypothetical protein
MPRKPRNTPAGYADPAWIKQTACTFLHFEFALIASSPLPRRPDNFASHQTKSPFCARFRPALTNFTT